MSDASATVKSGKKMRLLVVDDEPGVCDCIRLLMAQEGHDVVSAHNGRAALEAFEPDKFDLVFTDYAMPGMKGDELAKAIKALAPAQPIMLISGLALTLDSVAGIDRIISKPFMLEDLRGAIAMVARQKKIES